MILLKVIEIKNHQSKFKLRLVNRVFSIVKSKNINPKSQI